MNTVLGPGSPGMFCLPRLHEVLLAQHRVVAAAGRSQPAGWEELGLSGRTWKAVAATLLLHSSFPKGGTRSSVWNSPGKSGLGFIPTSSSLAPTSTPLSQTIGYSCHTLSQEEEGTRQTLVSFLRQLDPHPRQIHRILYN